MNVINKESFYELIGSAIKSKRKEHGLTQTELANKSGMSRTSIVNIENGRQFPPVHLLWELSQVLECSPVDFYPNSSKEFYDNQNQSDIVKEIRRVSKNNNIKKESLNKITSFINDF